MMKLPPKDLQIWYRHYMADHVSAMVKRARQRGKVMIQPTWKDVKEFILLAFLVGLIFGIVFGIMIGRSEAATIPENLAVRAIIGEASNQGYDGMLAVACALRNRGTLRGVYGLKAKHIDREPKWVWNMARKAWRKAATVDVTGGATHWENVKAFGMPYWAKSMKLVYQFKDHKFYRP